MKRFLSTGAVVALSLTILTLLFSQQLGESFGAGFRAPAAPAPPAAPALPAPPAPPSGSFNQAFLSAPNIGGRFFPGVNANSSQTLLQAPFTIPGAFETPPLPFHLVVSAGGNIGPFWLVGPPARPGSMAGTMQVGLPNIITGIFGPVTIKIGATAGNKNPNGAQVANLFVVKPMGVGGGIGGMNGGYGGY